MNGIVENLEESLEVLKVTKSQLDVQLEGPISFKSSSKLVDYCINDCYELVLRFEEVKLIINLSEVYSYETKENMIQLSIDGGNIFTIIKKELNK